MLEAVDLAALRIDARHDVLACRVHRLKNQQQRMVVFGIEQALEFTHFPGARFESGFVILLRLVKRLHLGRPLFEFDLFAFADAEFFGFDFHMLMSWCNRTRAVAPEAMIFGRPVKFRANEGFRYHSPTGTTRWSIFQSSERNSGPVRAPCQ